MIPRGEFNLIFLLLFGTVAGVVSAEPTSADNDQLKRAFRQFPAADLNGDGKLTQTELRTFHRERAQRMRGGRSGQVFDTVFKPSPAELESAIAVGRKQGGSARTGQGEGLRIVMSGHSWVAPAHRTLPGIARAAGFAGHHQLAHLSGAATGAANAIWLKEFGKFRNDPPRPILVPAIAAGGWDVMTWGSYYMDKPEYFSQWIDLCLKYNPDMRFYIQDGWPRVNSAYLKMKPEAAMKKLDAEMNRMVKEYFTPAQAALNKKYPGKVHFIPAGPAVVELIRRYYADELPGFDCLSENLGGKRGIYRDGGHLSKKSGAEYLVGYVYYATLYRRSPELIRGEPPGVAPDLDKQLREIAWKAVVESSLSGIVDRDDNGLAD